MHTDVTIIGGGLAGLTLAVQLKQQRPSTNITIIEKQSLPLPDLPCKVGESTVEVSAHYYADVLDLKEHLKAEQLPKLGLRMFFSHADNSDLLKRLEFGSNRYFPRSTYQLDRARLERHLYQLCQKAGVVFYDHSEIKSLEISTNQTKHVLELQRGQQSDLITTRWLVDCSGRKSFLQHKLGLKESVQHNINSAWFRIADKINIDDWCSDPAWTVANKDNHTRWYSTNHLVGKGYWVWIIPLSRNSTSIGIVADPRVHPLNTFNSFEVALDWLGKHEPLCQQAVFERREKLEDFLAIKGLSKRVKQVFSADRWAISGDAGIFIDPYYSPGMDFIAFGNTFIADLICRELEGSRISELSRIYNDLFMSFADNTFQVYQDQYANFAAPQIMSVKIVWDFAIYWSFFAFLFCHNRLTDINLLARFKSDLDCISELNKEMQSFFLSCTPVVRAEIPRQLIEIAKNEYLLGLNQSLVDNLDDASFDQQLRANIKLLRILANEIAQGVVAAYPQLELPVSFTTNNLDSPSTSLIPEILKQLEL